jgi:hypothetical protein
MKLAIFGAVLFFCAAFAGDAQPLRSLRAASVYAMWNPVDVTAAILHDCRIAPGFWSAEKTRNGTALIRRSASLSSDQIRCTEDRLGTKGITIGRVE